MKSEKVELLNKTSFIWQRTFMVAVAPEDPAVALAVSAVAIAQEAGDATADSLKRTTRINTG